MRAIAFGITGAVHLIAVAVAAVALSWQSAGSHDRPRESPLVVLPTRAADMARDVSTPGSTAPTAAPLALAAKIERPAAAQPLTGLQNLGQAPSPSDPGGRNDDLAQVTLAYRRALMARLEQQRRYPEGARSSGRQGMGAVLFRIERSGNLLDATVAATTGASILDQAAIDIVRRSAPFPAIPEGLPDELAITLPIDFLIAGPAHLGPTRIGPSRMTAEQ